jgi:sporulation protein YlmC with PRC-barrel domain
MVKVICEILIRLSVIENIHKMMIEGNNLSEKKLRGSGGFVIAKVSDEEQRKGNLGGPDLFLAGVGRLSEDRFSKYYCNKCENEFLGSPGIDYEEPNEDVGEGVTLIEKGEYKCKACKNTIAQYRKFNSPTVVAETLNSRDQLLVSQNTSPGTIHPEVVMEKGEKADTPAPTTSKTSSTTNTSISQQWGFIPIQSLVGMMAYDTDAMLFGRVREIGLRKSSEGNMQVSVKIAKESSDGEKAEEVLWNNISKIGDIVLLDQKASGVSVPKHSICPSCGNQNEQNAVFCEECGAKLD